MCFRISFVLLLGNISRLSILLLRVGLLYMLLMVVRSGLLLLLVLLVVRSCLLRVVVAPRVVYDMLPLFLSGFWGSVSIPTTFSTVYVCVCVRRV